MAEIVDAFPTEPTYPWDQWFDGKIRKLTLGEDYTCAKATLLSSAYKQAKRRNCRVSLKTIAGHVYLQAHSFRDAEERG